MSTVVIEVDGEIGAGKTTFIANLAEAIRIRYEYNVVIVDEPVDEWIRSGALAKFYEDPEKYAYALQTMTFVTRIRRLVEKERLIKSLNNGRRTIVLLERSILTDRFVFMELQKSYLDEDTMRMYDFWWSQWKRMIPEELRPTKFIYLKPSIETCMKRVSERSRTCEKKGAGVGIDYQRRLRRAHEFFLEAMHEKEFSCTMRKPLDAKRDVFVVDKKFANEDFRLPHGEATIMNIINDMSKTETFRDVFPPAELPLETLGLEKIVQTTSAVVC